MSDETVLVVTARLDEALRRLVTEACEHARVRPVLWSAGGPEALGGSTPPSLLVAFLPSGQRTIPEDVVALATHSYPALPLLLLCGEPLVRHSVSLPGGRVTLLGQPLTREKISARIRMAVVGASSDDGSRSEDVGPLRVRELRGREWWAGVIAREPERTNGGPQAGDLLPPVCKLGRHGVAGLIPLNLTSPLSNTVLREAALGLATAPSPERGASGLESAVGAEAAALWFSTASFQWSFYAPKSDSEFWLYSPLRLPSPFRIAGGSGAPWRSLGAASGDVVVVAAGAAAAAERARGGELWKAAEGGGPAVLDYLEARLASEPQAASVLIVELR